MVADRHVCGRVPDNRMGPLGNIPFLLQLPELPLNELIVMGIQGCCNELPPEVNAHPHLPVIILCRFREKCRPVFRLLKLQNLPIREAHALHYLQLLLFLLPYPLCSRLNGAACAVPALREKHVESPKPFVPGHGLNPHQAVEMANVKVAVHVWVGECDKELRPFIRPGFKCLAFFPFLLPFDRYLLQLHIVLATRINYKAFPATMPNLSLNSASNCPLEYGLFLPIAGLPFMAMSLRPFPVSTATAALPS